MVFGLDTLPVMGVLGIGAGVGAGGCVLALGCFYCSCCGHLLFSFLGCLKKNVLSCMKASKVTTRQVPQTTTAP